jgi:DnaJ-class molecular chaperone
MSSDDADYYEVLQVSDSAEPETINRVYRIFAQRYHPDNRETGNETRFREITEAYQVLATQGSLAGCGRGSRVREQF